MTNQIIGPYFSGINVTAETYLMDFLVDVHYG
jgi:hypothetical protein